MIFEQLNKANKAKAIEATRNDENYLNYEWYDGAKEDFHTILELLGFYEIESYFSGFSSQGDGACFTAKYEYEKGSVKAIEDYSPLSDDLYSIAQRLQAIQAKVIYDLGVTIEHTSRYYHAKSVTVYLWSKRDRVSDDKLYEYEDEVTAIIEELSCWYYKQLNEQYDYLHTDEAIILHLEANEMEFDYENN